MSPVSGAISKVRAGGGGAAGYPYDPDDWLTSTWRGLRSYMQTYIGTSIYEFVLGYPSADDLLRQVPLKKTIIAFDIDDIANRPLGLGDTVVDCKYDEIAKTIEDHEAKEHVIMFSIGVWSSVESGGVTARLKAYQALDRLFAGRDANRRCLAHTSKGVDILSFTGGTFMPDKVGDVPVFRVVDAELRVRVFSRTRRLPVGFIETISLDEELRIDGVEIT